MNDSTLISDDMVDWQIKNAIDHAIRTQLTHKCRELGILSNLQAGFQPSFIDYDLEKGYGVFYTQGQDPWFFLHFSYEVMRFFGPFQNVRVVILNYERVASGTKLYRVYDRYVLEEHLTEKDKEYIETYGQTDLLLTVVP